MASFFITNIEATSFSIYVQNLQYPANEYDNFTIKMYQSSTLIFNWTFTTTSTWKTMLIDLINENYLGYNYATPNTNYDVEVIARHGGVNYSLGIENFTTKSVSPPTGTITPTVYTEIKDQGIVNNCIPMCLSTAMEIFKNKQTGINYEKYSASFIYGNGGYSWGMYNEEAVMSCVLDGSPRWELVEPNSDSKSLYDSEYYYQNADSYAKANAKLQAFDGYANIDFYDCNAVANAIRNYGYFMFNFRIPNNFYNVGSDGIVPQPDTYSGINHSVALIGLTTKNGKPHWIAQNSWGTNWGAGGIGYIPWDWGIGVLAPTRGGEQPTSWTQDCYSVWNNGISSSHPTAPINIAVEKTGDLTARVTWSSVPNATYTVFAKKQDGKDWYIKGRTTQTSLNISFDSESRYDIKILSAINNLYSDTSEIVSISFEIIKPWEWIYPKVSGGDFIIHWQEWRQFCDKINDVRQINGLSQRVWLVTFLKYVRSGEPFYARLFREVAELINEINGQVASECLNVKEGDIIYAWYFENLKTALNNAIP